MDFDDPLWRERIRSNYNELILHVADCLLNVHDHNPAMEMEISFDPSFKVRENLTKIRYFVGFVGLRLRERSKYRLLGIGTLYQAGESAIRVSASATDPQSQLVMQVDVDNVVMSLLRFFGEHRGALEPNKSYEVLYDKGFCTTQSTSTSQSDMTEYEQRGNFLMKLSQIVAVIQFIIRIQYGPTYNCLVYFTKFYNLSFFILIYDERDFDAQQHHARQDAMTWMLFRGSQEIMQAIRKLQVENYDLRLDRKNFPFIDYVMNLGRKQLYLAGDGLEDVRNGLLGNVQVRNKMLTISSYLNPMNFDKQVANTTNAQILEFFNLVRNLYDQHDIISMYEEVIQQIILYRIEHVQLSEFSITIEKYVPLCNLKALEEHVQLRLRNYDISISAVGQNTITVSARRLYEERKQHSRKPLKAGRPADA